MQKAIRIIKDVLALGIFLAMSYLMIKSLFLGASDGGWGQLSYELTLFSILSIAISGLSMLYALKKLL